MFSVIIPLFKFADALVLPQWDAERVSKLFHPPKNHSNLVFGFDRKDGSKIWVFPKTGVPQMDGLQWKTLLKMDDLGVPLFSETSILGPLILKQIHLIFDWNLSSSQATTFLVMHPPSSVTREQHVKQGGSTEQNLRTETGTKDDIYIYIYTR